MIFPLTSNNLRVHNCANMMDNNNSSLLELLGDSMFKLDTCSEGDDSDGSGDYFLVPHMASTESTKDDDADSVGSAQYFLVPHASDSQNKLSDGKIYDSDFFGEVKGEVEPPVQHQSYADF